MQSEMPKHRNAVEFTMKNALKTDAAIADLMPPEQSQSDREANYAEHADKVASKLKTKPGTMTEDEANTMYSREQKAFGTTEKGGLASQAQELVAEREGASK